MASTFVGLPPVGDEELPILSERNPGWKIERTDAGELRLSPTHSDSGAKSLEAAAQLRDYAKGAGGKAYDSSTRFKTPRGGVLCPDGAWISAEHVAAFDDRERRKFRTVTPDVVLELKSDTDDWQDVIDKFECYLADGCRYAVALDADARSVYAAGSPPTGLVLDFNAIFDA